MSKKFNAPQGAKKRNIFITAAVVAVVVIAGITAAVIGIVRNMNKETNSNSIIGTWVEVGGNNEWDFVFNEDGSCKVADRISLIHYKTTENNTIIFYDQFYYPEEPIEYKLENGKFYLFERNGDNVWEYVKTTTDNDSEKEDNGKNEKDDKIKGKKLSDSCDYVLASGTTTTGDEIELVANESESFDGKQSIGVIKNNKWLIAMTSDSPIIDEKSGKIILFDTFKVHYDKQRFNADYRLATDSCFILNCTNNIIWNFETNKIYVIPGDYRSSFTLKKDESTKENMVVLHIISEFTKNKSTWKILDTDTMTIVKEFPERKFQSVGIFSEGLFYAEEDKYEDIDGDGDTEKICGFYDKDGNRVIDLSKYYIEKRGYFVDGKATFKAKNKAGTEFNITIDKTGKVLSEEPV